MSDEHQEPENPIAKLIGVFFLISVPVVLIVMMGIVGVAFLKGSGVKPAKEAEGGETVVAAAAPAPAAPANAAAAPAPAAGETAAAAPAAPAPAAGGEIDPAVMALGKTSYALCAACHGADGKGLQAGPLLMAPSLVGSELLLGDPDKSLLVVLKGIQKENMNYMGMMAPLASGLDDEKLAAVLTYVRNDFGNSAPAVTVEQAAAARAKFADVNTPAGVKRGEIDAIVEAHK